MSGGHWDYSHFRISEDLAAVGTDETVRRRWPVLAKMLTDLAFVLSQSVHDMDWDISGDTKINDDAAFDLSRTGAVLDAVLKALPDEVFERGKWATIQAWQQRTGSEGR